jgi:two-component system NtrC family sensor kinase
MDSDGAEVIGGILTVEDVTSKVTMEQRLAVSERLAAVGKLAAKVAHELNNPLDGILRYINLAMRVIGDGGDQRAVRYLDESRSGLMRMVQIISELLEFSRSTYSAYETADINKVVEDAVKAMFTTTSRARVEVVTDYAPDMPTVRSGNLFQVFCNMIKNAADAMPDGGRLTVITRLTDRELSVCFEDTGIGLPEGQISQIFQPFFTTKEPGKGTGLGLAVCKDIVERYNGRIEASNREGGGARFLVRLPLESCRT